MTVDLKMVREALEAEKKRLTDELELLKAPQEERREGSPFGKREEEATESLELEKQIVKKNKGDIEVEFSENLLDHAIGFVRLLREDKNVEKKPSVRASIGLVERAKANCLIRKGARVSLEDIRDAVVSVLSHRIKLKPSFKYVKSPKEYISEEFSRYSERSKGLDEEGESP